MNDLANKSCEACRTGVEPLKGDKLIEYARKLGGQWKIINDHHIEKEYLFKDFKDALAFTNQVGNLAEQEGHHPDIVLSWGKVKVILWTHKIDGLSESDFILAAKCDKIKQPQ